MVVLQGMIYLSLKSLLVLKDWFSFTVYFWEVVMGPEKILSSIIFTLGGYGILERIDLE